MAKILLWTALLLLASLLACTETTPAPGTDRSTSHRGIQRDQHQDDVGHGPDVNDHRNDGTHGDDVP